MIHTQKRKYTTLLTLKNFEENLVNKPFLRVHKSFIAAINKIDSIESHEIVIHGTKNPPKQNYREEVMDKVLQKKLIDRKNGEAKHSDLWIYGKNLISR